MADEHRGSRFRLPWKGPVQRVARREAVMSPIQWRNTIHSRLLVCAAMLACWTVAIEARLVYLQVVQHTDMLARADRQQLRTIKLPAKRAEIVDRFGQPLAYSVDADTIAADPSDIENPEKVSRLVCGALEACNGQQRQQMAERLRGKGQFAYLARQITPEEASRVRALDIPGVLFYKESRRYYPNNELAAHLLGYVGVDNLGLAGLESTFDNQIRGHEGKILLQRDGRRKAMSTREERLPTAGASLELTIDKYLQFIADRELRIGVEENKAAGGTAIIMQPDTGEILALSNWPTFNPNEFGSTDLVARRNRAIQDTYEPGSTFKVVTASAAIEEGLIHTTDLIDCNPGYISFGPRKIYDTHHYGLLPFIDVIAKSSNVGAIKVGQRLGPDRLGVYINRFGFGQVLGTDFRGASSGIVWNPARLDPSALASVSMGYQVGVTPLQMATAISVVANGGQLLVPHVVRAFIQNGRRDEVPTKVVRRAITPDTAATLTEIMEAVVERGTAKKLADVNGFTVAGKTGTASKLVNGHYSKSDYNASFVGFVPSRKPALTIVVVIDSPHAKGYYGASVSGPVFARIAEASLRHLGIGPTVNPPSPVMRASGPEESDQGAVGPQRVKDEGAPIPPAAAAADGLMPDLRGMSAREAVRKLTQLGLTASMSGNGIVLEQLPAAGSVLRPDNKCVLKLGQRTFAAAGDSNEP
jgi:cell division protein FtsI (penicillin-binding protein 3)